MRQRECQQFVSIFLKAAGKYARNGHFYHHMEQFSITGSYKPPPVDGVIAAFAKILATIWIHEIY
jgi:hypothetical protein